VPFFSRRIGLGEFTINGEESSLPITILGGGKLVGRTGRTNIGFLTATTDERLGSPRTTFGALRVSRDILSRSNMGFIAITKNPSGRDDPFDPNDITAGNHSNETWGGDMNFSVMENLKFGGSYLLTETPGVMQSQRMGQAYVSWSNTSWDVSATHSDIGNAFNPEVGFVLRRGVEKTEGRLAWSWRSTDSVIRRIEPHFRSSYTADQEHRLATRFQHWALLMELRDGSEFEVAWNPSFDRLDDPFELSDSAVVPPGAYDMDEFTLYYEGDSSRVVSISSFLSQGDYFDGEIFTGNATLRARFSRYLKSSLGVERVEIDLPGRAATSSAAASPEAAFNTTLIQANVGVTFTTRLFADALLQYNTDVDDFSTNLRLNFKYRPGSDIYVVYNERRDIEGLPTDEVDRIFTVKWTYLFSI
jgi:hypothetical protein